MKILLINDYGYRVGGAETYLLNLKKELQKRGHIVKILTSDSGNRKLFSDYTFKGINQNSIFRAFPYMWNFDSQKILKKILAEFKPDIVHLQFVFYHSSPSILFALKDIPTAYTAHAHELIGPMGVIRNKNCKHPEEESCIYCLGFVKYFPEKIKMILFSLFKKSINIYISPSKHHYNLLNKYNYSPLEQVYNGITLLPAKKIKINNKLLYIGRLSKDKGVIYLLKSMPEILKTISDAELTIVGNGPEEIYLKQFVSDNNLEKNVNFVGKIESDKIVDYYNNCEIVIVPSTYADNLPTVCIEAMSVGRPIIGSNLGGIPELIDDGKTGYIITPGDHKEIAKKIITILTNKRLAVQMSGNAIIKSKQFDVKTHADQIEKIYKQLNIRETTY